MKLGRAPDTIVILIVVVGENDTTKIRFLREIICYFAYYFEYFLKIAVF